MDEAEGADGFRERGTLLVLVERVPSIPNVLRLSNACASQEGRDVLLVEGRQAKRQLLTRLLRLLEAGEAEKRLAGASWVRNCAMADECHDVLVGVQRRSQCAWAGQSRWDGRRWRRFAPGWSRKCCCCVRAGRGRTRSGMAGPSTFWRDGRGKSIRDDGAVDVLEGWKGEEHQG
ncbi:unnamed protein product [Chondrus crispus]|uniref:Uncharacterized protein n=1 Tax=Chondrus crispus TaxID=2769 RepID=R7QEF3_CHOCR|nr:unnamed protein product [Chondrus crispus]CDF35810.1 unnamed protein product [Chondrus crispus]|eukprot:XP_005715629.1 unnamed protein product [Chondrus crispus]